MLFMSCVVNAIHIVKLEMYSFYGNYFTLYYKYLKINKSINTT